MYHFNKNKIEVFSLTRVKPAPKPIVKKYIIFNYTKHIKKLIFNKKNLRFYKT